MRRCAEFFKISLDQYRKDRSDGDPELEWNEIKLPARSTAGSAGYDFRIPYDFTLCAGESCKVMTGVRCQMDSDIVLHIYPRSSLGFKHGIMLANTVGIVDADYFDNPNNEGHIMIKLVNTSDHTVEFKAGDAVAQGVLTQYCITCSDDASAVRTGGFGSTGK